MAEQAMQGMAHLMEQRHRIVKRKQTRVALVKIGIVDDDGKNLSVQPVLVAEAKHPGAALLSRTGEIVAIEQSDRLALAPDFPHPHVGMIDGDVMALLE